MQHQDLFAHLNTSPLVRVSTLLASDVHVGHGPETFSCERCRSRWVYMREVLSRREDPQVKLKLMASAWRDDHEISETCGSCDGCRLELGAAAQTAVLSIAGVNIRFLLGPMHPVTEQKSTNTRCRHCRQWLNDLATNAARITSIGRRPQRWLPDKSSVDDRHRRR